LIKPHDIKLALQVYYRAEVHPKVIIAFAETGDFDKIIAYSQKVGYRPDWTGLLNQLLAYNPEAAASFAAKLISAPGGALLDVNTVVDSLLQRGLIQQVTSLLLDVLKNNKPEEAALQTKLLEINLISAPAVADAILANEMFTHYDRLRIAQLCEKAGLFQRALEHYHDLKDIMRVMANTHVINPEVVCICRQL
jgi:clathrin heavy chain